MNELHAFVFGNIQGIGFRAMVRKTAEQKNLKGFVRNLEDGRVEFLVQGEKQDIESLIDAVTDRFSDSIEQIKMQWTTSKELFPAFEIRL